MDMKKSPATGELSGELKAQKFRVPFAIPPLAHFPLLPPYDLAETENCATEADGMFVNERLIGMPRYLVVPVLATSVFEVKFRLAEETMFCELLGRSTAEADEKFAKNTAKNIEIIKIYFFIFISFNG